MTKKHKSTRKQEANDFIIWRAGTSVEWDCTIAELARETGLNQSVVGDACRRRKWRLLDGNRDVWREDLVHRFDVIQMMKGMPE